VSRTPEVDPVLPEGQSRGIVLRSTAGFFDVLLPTGVVRARLRGRLKRVKQNTDLCVIGDQVHVAQAENGSVTVEEVLPRRTVFSRQHPARAADTAKTC
jgi:ribosome biogenesis GTPase